MDKMEGMGWRSGKVPSFLNCFYWNTLRDAATKGLTLAPSSPVYALRFILSECCTNVTNTMTTKHYISSGSGCVSLLMYIGWRGLKGGKREGGDCSFFFVLLCYLSLWYPSTRVVCRYRHCHSDARGPFSLPYPLFPPPSLFFLSLGYPTFSTVVDEEGEGNKIDNDCPPSRVLG
ncbi:hypothetical protein F4775DRAFT_333419 [Biscogniauxia sp. FL1348]|nr:hypothetical protein F4775DRAFT_333419 [Biscogniauxia sp. FL1348]